MVELNDNITDFNCYSGSPSQTYGNKGVTIWQRTTDVYLAPNGGTWTGHFTCTVPRCFTLTTVCNLTYKIHTTTTSSNNDVGPIVQNFSSIQYIEDVPVTISGGPVNLYHSRLSGHDAILTHDLWMATDPNHLDIYGQPLHVLLEDGENTITFTNNDQQVGVYIQGLQIVRSYDMSSLGSTGCVSDYSQPEGSDFVRADYPCNYEKCGASVKLLMPLIIMRAPY